MRRVRAKRNKLLRQINNRLRDLAYKRADQLATYINSTDNWKRMFHAVNAIRATISPLPLCVNAIRATISPLPLCVHGAEGHYMGTDQGKADTFRQWFEQQFKDPAEDPLVPLTGEPLVAFTGEPLVPYTGEPRPLLQPVTPEEIGPDGIQKEMLKRRRRCLLNCRLTHHQHCV